MADKTVYAAICVGSQEDGTWFVLNAGSKTPDLSDRFFLYDNGVQFAYDFSGRLMVVVATGQIITNAELRGLGPLPASWAGKTRGEIIQKILRTGDYLDIEGFVIEETDDGV